MPARSVAIAKREDRGRVKLSFRGKGGETNFSAGIPRRLGRAVVYSSVISVTFIFFIFFPFFESLLIFLAMEISFLPVFIPYVRFLPIIGLPFFFFFFIGPFPSSPKTGADHFFQQRRQTRETQVKITVLFP